MCLSSLINLFSRKPAYQRTPDDLRLLAFADLHWLSEEEWQVVKNVKKFHPDVILLLGDIGREEATFISSAAGKIPVLSVLGNHDTWNQYNDIPNIIHLDGDTWQHRDTMFAGISGSIRYKSGKEYCMRTQEEMMKITEELSKADILLSHDGPYHLMSENQTHEGLKGVSHYIEKYHPSLSVFGHQHDSFEGFSGKTKAVCVFRCAIIDTATGAVEKIF